MLFFEAVIFQTRPPVGYDWLIFFTSAIRITSLTLELNLSQIGIKSIGKHHPYRERQMRFYRAGVFLLPCCIVYKLVLDSGITAQRQGFHDLNFWAANNVSVEIR